MFCFVLFFVLFFVYCRYACGNVGVSRFVSSGVH